MNHLSRGSKLAYGSGGVVFAIKDAAFAMFVLLFYKQVLGLSGALTGLAIFISVLWDAVSDPVIGAWSDRLKTRWGRRHPMMLAGSIPLGLSFVLLFNPAGFVLGSQWPLFGWLLVSVILMRTFLTVFIVPHTAMGAEITADYVERTSVVSYRTNLAWIFGVLLPAISLPLLFATVDGQDGRFIIENYQRYGWVSCLLVLVMSFICIVGTRQFIPRLLEVAGRNDSSPGFSGLVRDGLGTLKNMNFRRILILDIAVGATMGIVGALHMITMTYFWEASALQISLLATAYLLAAVLVMPSMNYMANRWQKQTYLKVAVVGLVFNAVWLVPGRLLGWMPENGTTFLFVLLYVHGFLSTLFAILRSIGVHSIMADIVDEHELETGRRQEGVFFASATFAQKFVMGFGYMIGGPLLDIVGLEAGVAPGDVPASALFGIGLVIGPVMALLLLVPWWMTNRLEVSRERSEVVQTQLAARA